ncbi:MAG: beta-porphyranase A [Rikenellaceae bacterium]
MKKLLLTTFSMLLAIPLTMAATPAAESEARVSFNHNVQRFIGDASALDRNRYFNLHSLSDKDPDMAAFFEKYDVNIGRSFGGPLAYAAKLADNQPCIYDVKLPNDNPNHSGVRPLERNFVTTEHTSYLHGEMDTKAAGEFAAKYFSSIKSYQFPSIFEPINEAFVHAKDKKFRPTSTADMKVVISKYYRDAARAIHATPYLANMKVIGDGAAYPSYEIANFKQFRDNTQVFLDIAGRDMDAISVHLYDGVNIEGQATKRSGSNSEAILDLLETYTAVNFGKVKPLAITEFGGIIKIPGTGDGDLYHEKYSPLVVLSMNHIFHNLMERQDNLIFSVPFIGDKATWYLNNKKNTQKNSYTSVLFTPEDPMSYPKCNWVINDKVFLFELWKDVKGDRIDIKTSNPDIQAMAFRDGKKLYIAMDNLHDKTITTTLEALGGTENIKSAEKRSLTGVWGKGLHYKTSKLNLSTPLKIEPDECLMLVIDLKKATPYKGSITRTKYYSPDHLVTIESGKRMDFNFGDNLPIAADGRVNVRMSIGRPIALTRNPKVWVNGKEVAMPTNWKGYDQADRKDFFGMIQIPFDKSLLKAKDNVITLQFSDNGGSVSSMILEVESYK